MDDATYARMPAHLRLREVQVQVAERGFRVRSLVVVTTLLDSISYPADELATLYRCRWLVKTSIGHLKTSMKMDVLRCETVRGVTKELTMFLLVYNLVRMTMLEAARRQGVPVERISFVDALRWLAMAAPGDPLPELVVTPLRSGRLEPRVRKRPPKEYDLMKKPRAVLRQLLAAEAVTA